MRTLVHQRLNHFRLPVEVQWTKIKYELAVVLGACSGLQRIDIIAIISFRVDISKSVALTLWTWVDELHAANHVVHRVQSFQHLLPCPFGTKYTGPKPSRHLSLRLFLIESRDHNAHIRFGLLHLLCIQSALRGRPGCGTGTSRVHGRPRFLCWVDSKEVRDTLNEFPRAVVHFSVIVGSSIR